MKYVGVKTTGELRLHEVKEPQTDEIYMAVEDDKLGAVPIRPYEFVKWDGKKWIKVPDVKLATSLDIGEITINAFSATGIFPYYGDTTDLNNDTTADRSKFFFDARTNVQSFKRVMFYSVGGWRTLPNNETVDTVSNIVDIQRNNASRVLFDIFAGKIDPPTVYAGGLGAIQRDATVDKSKVYYSTIVGPNKLMYWDSGFSCWMFAGEYTNQDYVVFNDLFERILGIIPYNGDHVVLANDPKADKTKKYLLNDGTICVWNYINNVWTYFAVYNNVEETFAKVVGAWPYYGGGLSSINADPNVDTDKVYFITNPGTNYLKKMVYDQSAQAWSYADFINNDVNASLCALFGGIVGAVPYFGGQSTIAADTTADKTKTYFMALASSANFLKTMYWDESSSSWVYGDKVTSFQRYDAPVNIENEKVRAYLDNTAYDNTDYTYTEVLKYAADNYDKPNGFTVTWEFAGTCDSFNVKVSLTGDFADGKTYTYNVANTARSFVVKNLDPSKVAGVKVSSVTGGVESVVISKAIPCEGRVRMLDVGGIRNVRDIGGWDCGNGKHIKYGKLFRGSAIDESGSTITAAGKAVLYNLNGIRAEIDLRSTASPTTSDIGASCVKYSITGYSYINGFNNTSDAYNVFSRVFTEIASGHPIYMHCSGGCDRTAFYVCMLEGLLGMSENDITKDFELSSFMDKAYSNNYRRYRSMGVEYTNRDWLGLITLIKGLTGSTWGEKFETYFTSLGFTQSDIDSVRTAMLA